LRVGGEIHGRKDTMAREKPVIISINETLCKGADGCGICLALCPKDVFKVAERLTSRGIRPPQIDKITACTNCGNCMIYCPDMAIVVRLEEVPEAAAAVRTAE
jgi:2-oxoglutarate ferredoxin oxidoreductase subunit delta